MIEHQGTGQVLGLASMVTWSVVPSIEGSLSSLLRKLTKWQLTWYVSLQYFSVVCCVSVWSWCVSVTANTSALTCTWLQWVVMELLLLSHALSLSVKNLDRYASYCPTKLARSRRFSLHILYSFYMYIMVRMYAKQVATVLVAEALIAMVCPCCMLLVAFDRFEHWMCPLSNGCSVHAPPPKMALPV